MKKISFATGALFLAAVLVAPLAFAQTQTTMPVFYNQTGQPVNTGNTALPAGYYYLQSNGQGQVYYYGNGVYYDATAKTYGGSVHDPSGTAGVALNYAAGTVAVTPTAPNTGLGGNAASVWAALVLSATVVLAGAAYIVTSRHEHFA